MATGEIPSDEQLIDAAYSEDGLRAVARLAVQHERERVDGLAQRAGFSCAEDVIDSIDKIEARGVERGAREEREQRDNRMADQRRKFGAEIDALQAELDRVREVARVEIEGAAQAERERLVAKAGVVTEALDRCKHLHHWSCDCCRDAIASLVARHEAREAQWVELVKAIDRYNELHLANETTEEWGAAIGARWEEMRPLKATIERLRSELGLSNG